MNAKYAQDSNALFQEIDQEAVILSLDRGRYYSLNPTAVSIWKVLEEGPKTIDEIVHVLSEEYDFEINDGIRDVTEACQDMTKFGVITRTD